MYKNSIWLYLKQGLKGVVKFRIQFYVIVILTFISSLILGISLSASTRILNNYNEIMPKMDKFNYVSSREVGTKKDNDPKIVPMADLIDYQFLAGYYSIKKDKTDSDNKSYGYNFNLISVANKNESKTLSKENNQDSNNFYVDAVDENGDYVIDPALQDQYKKNYQETFISNAFSQKRVKDSFFSMLSNPSFLETFFHYKYDSVKDEVEYKSTYNKYQKLEITGSTIYADYVDGSSQSESEIDYNYKKDIYGNFFTNAVYYLREYYLQDLASRKAYLKDTTFDKLWQRDIINKDNFSQLFAPAPKEDEIDDSSKQYAMPTNVKYPSKYDLYLINAISSLVGQVINSVIEYIQYYIDSSIAKVTEEQKTSIVSEDDLKVMFNKVEDEKGNTIDNPGFEWYDSSDNLDSKKNKQIANVLYAYVFGNFYSSDLSEYKEQYKDKIELMQFNSDKKQVPYVQQVDLSYSYEEPNSGNTDSKIKNEAQNILEPTANIEYDRYVCKNATEKYSKGLRGSINQLVVELDIDNMPTGTVGKMSDTKILKFEDEKSTINNELASSNGFNYFVDRFDYSRTKFNSVKLYYLKSDIVGEATNVTVEHRAEMALADTVQELKYRMVVLDELWNSRLTIVSGQEPKADNEILINSQFAKANNIKLGSSMSIGGSAFIISGFAVDPLTFYPVADLDVPIPNIKKGVIIYAKEDTLKRIVTEDFSKFTSKVLNTFVTANNTSKSENAMVDYLSTMMNNESYLYQAYNAKQKYTQAKTNNSVIENQTKLLNSFNKGYESFKSFDESTLSYNWTLAPMVTKIFQIFSYTVSFLIALIALAATLIAIKKTIEMNAGEITILKAMGATSSSVSVSYLSYGIISSFIIAPVAWLLSSFFQEWIVSLLISYTGGAYWQATFDWQALLVTLGIFGALTLGVSYYVAYRLVKKPVLEIAKIKDTIKKNVYLERIKEFLTKNKSFSKKFSTELAINGFSKTFLTAITIFIASFFIAGAMAIPGVVKKTLNDYYKSVNYTNAVNYVDLVGNGPLSKSALSAWQGVESYEDKYIDTQGKLDSGIGLIGKSTSSTQPISDHSVMPKVLISSDDGTYKKVKYDWTYSAALEGIKNENGEVAEDANVISFIASIFGNNIVEMLGKSISIGDIQLLLDWIIHSDDPKYDNLGERQQKLSQYSTMLTTGLPSIIKTVLSSGVGDLEGTWKEQIVDVILTQTPAYIRNYLNISENRKNQYRFGWTFNTYIPGTDSMFTQVNMKNKNDEVQVTGLDSTQVAYKLPENGKNIFLNQIQLNEIENILFNRNNASQNLKDIKVNGITIYDAQSRTLNIPTLANEESSIKYKYENSALKDMRSQVTRMILAKDATNIPNSAWKYDDRDYVYYKTGDANLADETGWIDPASLSDSKFTYASTFAGSKPNEIGDGYYVNGFNRYSKTKKIVNNSYGFYNINSQLDKNGNETLNAEIRPYYQYDDVMLFIPEQKKDDFNSMLNAGDNTRKDAWYGTVSKEEVPSDTRNDWKKALGQNSEPESYLWIRPYSLYFESSKPYSKPTVNLVGKETENFTNERRNFLQYAFSKSDNPITVSSNVSMDWNSISEGNVKEVNLTKYKSIPVYGSKLIIADQGLTNLINGYNTSRYIPFNFSYEDAANPSGEYEVDGVKIGKYKLNDPLSMISDSRKNDWVFGKDSNQKSIRPSMWYNGSYSNASEPYFMTTQGSFSMSPRIGDYSINVPNNFTSTVEIGNIKLLSEEKNLINQIATLIITIGVFFIIFIVIVSTLSIILISDLYVTQYKKFMVVMKSLGYSNREIINYTFRFVTLWSFSLFLLGTILSYCAVYFTMQFVSKNIMSIPVGFMWWTPLLSSILIMGSYIFSISVTTKKIRKESPTVLVL
ncbi:ABC transporter permease [Spiroplasma gladiatoris]|uniref:ABC transporter permease n=1 Tax=Spiroplasma gladiatoris TaxID=2143 RepID=A0A4P7AGP7_9MOLU|nr:ABC transporter permease [Spiroplasma gladiatoris]QBQ07575.1 ABC transporter permease [Spiroplasma gladiatoris]